MISWWQAIFQISWVSWEILVGNHVYVSAPPPYSRASCILGFWKNLILLIQVNDVAYLTSSFTKKELQARQYKAGCWPPLSLTFQESTGKLILYCVSSTTHWFLYLHHNLFVRCNCLAQWGPQWEPQGISIIRITNNSKEEEQKEKHYDYKNSSKLHQAEEFQSSEHFKTGNRSKWEHPTLAFILSCDVYLQRIMACTVCIASVVRTYQVRVQWSSRSCSVSGIITATRYNLPRMVFFPIFMFQKSS